MNNDSRQVSDYWKEYIDKSQVVSREEECALSQRINTGDREAINKLVEANFRLVILALRKFKNLSSTAFDYEDMIQVGNIGLVEAAERFDHNTGYCFSTFAVNWIQDKIKREINKRRRFIYLPETNIRLLVRIFKIKERYQNNLDRCPTVEEIACETGEKPSRIEKIMTYELKVFSFYEMFTMEQGDETEIRTEKEISDLASLNPSKDITDMVDSKLEIESALRFLNDRERKVIQLLYGVGSYRGYGTRTLQEVADIMQITREWVRQIKLQAFKKIKNYLLNAV